MSDFTRCDDLRRVQFAQNGIFGQIKPIHPRVEAEIEEPGADFLIAEGSIFHARAMGSNLSEIEIDKECIGHGGPFRIGKCNVIFCRAERIGQRESLAGWGILFFGRRRWRFGPNRLVGLNYRINLLHFGQHVLAASWVALDEIVVFFGIVVEVVKLQACEVLAGQ